MGPQLRRREVRFSFFLFVFQEEKTKTATSFLIIEKLISAAAEKTLRDVHL